MRTLFNLGLTLALLIIASFSSKGQMFQNKSADNNLETKWISMHWIIERSHPDTVKRNFNQFIVENQIDSTPKKCKDGTYFGITPIDDYGYFHLACLTVKNGKIVKIHYDEMKNDGHNKRTDPKYNQEMEESGTTPAIAYPNYEKQLLEKQNFQSVDAVTGATYSLYRFRMAVAKAMEKGAR